MDAYDALTKLATLVAEIAACSHEALGTDRAQRINARCFEIVRAFAEALPDDREGRGLRMTEIRRPTGVHNSCGDICPTDTAERCLLDPGHDGWHEGKRLRWRRE